MSATLLAALIASSPVVIMQDVENVSTEQRRELETVLLRLLGPGAAPGELRGSCEPLDRCLLRLRASYRTQDITLVKVFAGVTELFIQIQRFPSERDPPRNGEVHLPLDDGIWASTLERAMPGMFAPPTALPQDEPAKLPMTPTLSREEPFNPHLVGGPLLGASAVGAGVAIAFTVSAFSARSALLDGMLDLERRDRLTDRMNGHATIAAISGGIAVGMLVTALIVYAVDAVSPGRSGSPAR